MRHMTGGDMLARRLDIEHRIIEENVGAERLTVLEHHLGEIFPSTNGS